MTAGENALLNTMKLDKTLNSKEGHSATKRGKMLTVPRREMQDGKKTPVGKNRSKLNFNFICPGFTFSTKTGRA